MMKARGFTLVELLVVMGIMAGLVALMAPVLWQAKDRVHRAECANGLRQVWAGLSAYAQEHSYFLPEGSTAPERLPAPTARCLAGILDGRIELLYCRTCPKRAEDLGAWQGAIRDGNGTYEPSLGYLYLAGTRFQAWDVPNEALPDDFIGARRIESVGQGVGNTADAVWLADFARCSTTVKADRRKPANWKLTSHPPQCVADDQGREDYRLPDGANVLFEDGHVTFRAFQKLRPRLRLQMLVHYW
jgi:prepilin-type N-terminal cleavage/methylation domain-containing protein/prepilin-type processing-associated H-X9-DG protein